MIKRLFVQVVETISSTDPSAAGAEDRAAALRLATAILMIDVARADYVFEESEFDHVLNLIEARWQIAYADGRLDKYEDSLVLKISDLLYVSRGLVMRLKHDAEIAAN
jgi:uncharacterized tellurite resistance protein B-like protein